MKLKNRINKCIILSSVSILTLLNFTACTTNNKKVESTRLNFELLTEKIDCSLSDSFNESVLINKNATTNVDVIIELEDNPLIEYYNDSYNSYASFYSSDEIINKSNNIINKQVELAKSLADDSLISSISKNFDLLLNGFSVTTTYDKVSSIRSYPGVKEAHLSLTYSECETSIDNSIYNDSGININDTEYDGSGMLVAVVDSGFNVAHEAFVNEANNPKLNKDSISKIITNTKAYELSNEFLSANDVYYSSKIPFMYDYANEKSNVYPLSSDHGTHVAGIIGGNSTKLKGVACQTQLALLKVFDDESSGASEEDILNALEDCLLLDVDVINLSLGSPAGFSSEDIPDTEISDEQKRIDNVFTKLTNSGISVICAAGNEYSSTINNEYNGNNLSNNPDSGNVGSPSSYVDNVSVASINSEKTSYALANNEKIFFSNPSTSKNDTIKFLNEIMDKYSQNPLAENDGNGNITIPYICVDGLGEEKDFEGLDCNNKIVVVKRGTISFADKIRNAINAGAFAVIIYNNLIGSASISVGDQDSIPSAFTTLACGKVLTSNKEGTITFNSQYYITEMSSFSSLGPTEDLLIKPEVTSVGGSVYSSLLDGSYGKMSGTSMACPNTAGAYVIVKSYLNKKYKYKTKKEIATLANQLIMSTANIIYDYSADGNPYFVRKQGAGLVSIKDAINSSAYLSVEGSDKAKLELGDDKEKSGKYNMTFTINNTSDKDLTYTIDKYTLTDTVDEETKVIFEKSKLLDSDITINGSSDNQITVSKNSNVTINVELSLTEESKKYLDDTFENGMYVEGFITLTSLSNDEDLSIPYLAFYGNWLDASMFDADIYDDKDDVSIYQTTPYGNYDDYYIIPLGKYIFELPEGSEKIAADMEKAAVSNDSEDAIYGIYSVYTGLLRNAKTLTISITDLSTNKVVFKIEETNVRKARYYPSYGETLPYVEVYDLFLSADEYIKIFANNVQYEVNINAAIDYESGNEVKDSNYSFRFYCDNEAPMVNDVNYHTENIEGEEHYFIDLTTYDNRYVQAIRPLNVVGMYFSSLDEYLIPVNQEEAGKETVTSIDITDYLSSIYFSSYQDCIYFMVYDYAMNYNAYIVSLNGLLDENLSFTSKEITIGVNDQIDLNDYLNIEGVLLQGFSFKSSNSSIADVSKNTLFGLSSGKATITASLPSYGKELSFNVVVIGKGSADIKATDIDISAYVTQFSFNDDYEYSDLYETDTASFLPIDHSFELYPSESLRLYSLVYPEIASNVTIKYESSDPSKVSVDSNGIVMALEETEEEKPVTITAYVYQNGNKTDAFDTITISVNSPYITTGSTLIYYKGFGGDVTIPEDLYISTIASYAFSHYNLKEKEDRNKKDEETDTIYEAIGDNTKDPITSITLPSTVSTINSYAFANLKSLTKVTLSTKVDTISSHAFEGCSSLSSIYLGNVKYLESYSFKDCTSLKDINLDSALSIGNYAFENTSVEELVIARTSFLGEGAFKGSKLSKITTYTSYINKNCFENCNNLKTVKLYQSSLKIADEAFKGCSKLSSITYSSSIKNLHIGVNAFDGTNLTELTLPNADIILDDLAFSNASISKVILSNNTKLTLLGASFANNKNFDTINVTSNSNYYCNNNVLLSSDMKTIILVANKVSYSIPSSVKTIGNGAFAGNNKVKKLTLTNLNVGKEAFAYSSVTSLTLTNCIIDDYAFANTTNLENVGLSSSTIGKYVFKDGLTSKSTMDCSNLTLSSFAFANSNINKINSYTEKTIPEGLCENCSNLSSFNFINVKKINANAFNNCSKLNNIDLNSVETIANYAFAQTGITSLSLSSIKTIGEHSFENTNNLTNVNLGNAIKVISNYAFNKSSIYSINLENIVTIGDYAFNNTTNLSNVDLSSSTNIGDYAFAESGISSADLSYANNIGDYAFYKTNISNVNLSRIDSIGSYAFASSNLSSINLSFKVKSIGMFALFDLSKLEQVTIIEATTYSNDYYLVENGVLYEKGDNDSLSLIVYPTLKEEDYYYVLDNTVYIAPYAFYNKEGLATIKDVYFPSSLKAIGGGAFYNALDLTNLYFESSEAPILEGYYEFDEITDKVSSISSKDNKAKELYKIDGDIISYYYSKRPYCYNNFKEYIGFIDSLSIYYPKDSTGYNSYIYSNYFTNFYEAKTYANRETNALIYALEKLRDVKEADVTSKRSILDAYDKYVAITDEEQLSLIDSSDIDHLLSLYEQAKNIKGYVITSKEVRSIVGKFGLYNYLGYDYELTILNDCTGYFFSMNRENTSIVHTVVFNQIIYEDGIFYIQDDDNYIAMTFESEKAFVTYNGVEITLIRNAKRDGITQKTTVNLQLFIYIILGLAIITSSITVILYITSKKKEKKSIKTK